LGEKTLVNFGPQTKKFYWLVLTNPGRHFSGDYISAIRVVLRPEIFKPLEIDQGYLASAHPKWDGVPPPKKINRENLKFGLKFSV